MDFLSLSMTNYNFLMLSLVALASVLFLKKRKRSKLVKLPPGPPKLPLIGNLHQLGNSPSQSLQKLSREYGPIMYLQLGFAPTLIVSSPEIAREIFKNHDVTFSGRPSLYTSRKLSYNCSDISFSPYGECWREIRKIAIVELLSSKKVQSFQAVRDEEITLMIERIAHSDKPVNLSKLTLFLANDVVSRVAFGKKFNGGGDGKSNFQVLLSQTQDLLGGFSVSDFLPFMEWINKFNGLEARLKENFGALDKLYDEVIAEHVDPSRPKIEHEDIVDVLLRLQKDPNQAIAITNNHIKGVLTDTFVAGTDTTAATLVWTMTQLIRNPRVMKKAQEELRTKVCKKGNVEESDLLNLPYLNLVLKESLRLCPPIPLSIPRETTEECIISGYKIPAKTRVFFLVKSLATDHNYWKNPNEFYPERFLDSSVDFRGQSFEFLPFGAGRRGCPGLHFAVNLIEIALANLLYQFDWSLPDGMKAEDLDMEEAAGITMHKKVPLELIATPALL